MGSRSEALAKKFEARADEALATLQRLNLGLLAHLDEHYGSIRRAGGHPAGQISGGAGR